jgi:hypothetical protein
MTEMPIKFRFNADQMSDIIKSLDTPRTAPEARPRPDPPVREPVAKKMAVLAHLPAEYPPDLPKFLHKQVLAERYSSDLEAPWTIFAYDPDAFIDREFQVPASCLRILDDPVPSTPPDDDIAF